MGLRLHRGARQWRARQAPARAHCGQGATRLIGDRPMTTQSSSGPAAPISRVVVRSLVRTAFERPPENLVAEIARADVTVLSELVGRMYTMNTGIRALAAPALPLTGVF